jgi:phosphoenolpyruvate synthase/pyruvate phosphate dikinase
MSRLGPKIWQKNFDIRRVDFNLPIETAPGFGGSSYLTIGKNPISQFIWIVRNGDNEATYFLKNELRELIVLTLKKILENPKHCDKIHAEATKFNREYLKLAKKIRNLKIHKLSNSELLNWHRKLFNLQFTSHVWSLPTTWFVDSDGEDLSKNLISFLQDRIREQSLKLDPAMAFSVLSTPKGESFTAQEEIQSLKIVAWVKKNPKLKHWFMNQTTESLLANFHKLPKSWQNKMYKHFYNYCWLPYTYIGPAYTLDYYLETWRGLLHEDVDVAKEIKNKKNKTQIVQKEKEKLIKLLELTPLEKHWFKVAEDIVKLKNFRKEITFHGFFVLDILLKELGKRSGLSLMQTKYLLPSELPKALKGKDYSQHANDRQKFCVIYGVTPKNFSLAKKQWVEKGIKIFTGKKAKKFLEKQKFEKVKVIKTNELFGTCACPGSAKGVIKIINIPDEMGKMNQGDIMLSHTTFPALVPAMKKASAIITEDGGITCHAAIVARELQTPCVVGCKNALSIFKDGDMVEVNANTGIVKLIKK